MAKGKNKGKKHGKVVEMKPAKQELALAAAAPQPEARYGYYGSYWSSQSFNGEKTPGELGPIVDFAMDFDALRARGWQLFIESEVCQTVLRRFTRWKLGGGLKMKAMPRGDEYVQTVLRTEKIQVPEDIRALRYDIETRFDLFADSTIGDYAGMRTLHELAGVCDQDSLTGGDTLVILRVKNGNPTVQLIDGAHLINPNGAGFSLADFLYQPTGNRVRNGVEIDAAGQHVAYHVRTGADMLETSRIAARNKQGFVVAYLVYGLNYRLDSTRGLPIITAVMEKAKKLDRYTEAVIGSAEERQKIAYVIQHGAASIGKNPLAAAASRGGWGAASTDFDYEGLTDRVHSTSGKQTYNLPNDATMAQLASDNELNYAAFHGPMVDVLCATVGIPPDVAMSKYNGSFSAARAALKDWEHTLIVERKRFANQFYQPIYNLWLFAQALAGKIDAPGYLQAVQTGNAMALKAYQSTRFIGTNVPHIDPLKEANAERVKLGTAGAHLPLTTLEQSTEALNGGEADSNVAQFAEELEGAELLGIMPEVAPGQPGDNTAADTEEDA